MDRSLRFVAKPLITAMTTIKVITPTASPRMEMRVFVEIYARLLLGLRYLRHTESSYRTIRHSLAIIQMNNSSNETTGIGSVSESMPTTSLLIL